MKVLAYFSLPLSLLLIACATEKKEPNTTIQPTLENTTTQEETPQTSSTTTTDTTIITTITTIPTPTNTCSATINSEHSFNDAFYSANQSDITPLWDAYTPIPVSKIAQTFNQARDNDPTITTHITLPTQDRWDNMSQSQQALFLINSERCARGIRPFEGIAPEVVTSPAQTYANYISTHDANFVANPHKADGRTPWQRLEQDANVIIGTKADFFSFGENLAYQSVASSITYPPTIHETTAKSVYGWLYEDQRAHYGHRLFLLATSLIENAGEDNIEGLIGVATSKTNYTTVENGQTFYWTKIHTVLNGFDPNENWSMSNVLYK